MRNIDTRPLERHVNALVLARECALLGARPRTIAVMTGLERYEVIHLLFTQSGSRKSGQSPNSCEWFFGKAHLFDQLDASLFMVKFDRLARLGVTSAEALVTAYKQYRLLYEEGETSLPTERGVRISFDRAFDLACHAYGVWGIVNPSLMLADCRKCGSRYLTALASRPDPGSCVFCKLLKRHRPKELIAKMPQAGANLPSKESLTELLASILAPVS